MSDRNVASQSTLESQTSPSEATTASRVSACERLVDEAIERDMGATWLGDSLKAIGLRSVEARDYIEEYGQRMEIRRAKARQPDTHEEPVTEAAEPVDEQGNRDDAVEEAAWAALRSKLEMADHDMSSGSRTDFLDRMFEFLGQETSSSSSLSKSVIAVAPHLADDQDSVFDDAYLNETLKCKSAFANQKPFENLIIKAQGRRVLEPIANSIWKLVILDKYVDFEKLYATLDPGYNPNDEAKEINEKFTLLEKNSISSR